MTNKFAWQQFLLWSFVCAAWLTDGEHGSQLTQEVRNNPYNKPSCHLYEPKNMRHNLEQPPRKRTVKRGDRWKALGVVRSPRSESLSGARLFKNEPRHLASQNSFFSDSWTFGASKHSKPNRSYFSHAQVSMKLFAFHLLKGLVI